jgi:hypothetical protein
MFLNEEKTPKEKKHKMQLKKKKYICGCVFGFQKQLNVKPKQ